MRKNLKEARQKAGMTQQEMADKACAMQGAGGKAASADAGTGGGDGR